jgi:hypothetical protein
MIYRHPTAQARNATVFDAIRVSNGKRVVRERFIDDPTNCLPPSDCLSRSPHGPWSISDESTLPRKIAMNVPHDYHQRG